MPKKRFGQHFLTNPDILRRIVEFARITPGSHVVEIGPGRGTLTSRLAAVAGRVTAVEVDSDLVEPLRQSMPGNVDVLECDALTLDYTALGDVPYAVVGNLPYNIATPLLGRFVANRERIRNVSVMVQKEVADRILAGPGERQYGPLSIGIQYYADVEAGFVLAPGSFNPPPRVHSRMIRLQWKERVTTDPVFIRFTRTAFSSRRKKLINNLAAMFPNASRSRLASALENRNLAAGIRPEELSVSDFRNLFLDLTGRRDQNGRLPPIQLRPDGKP